MILGWSYLISQAERARARAQGSQGGTRAGELAPALRPRGCRWARAWSPRRDLNREGK
jgi:hypothetical protein